MKTFFLCFVFFLIITCKNQSNKAVNGSHISTSVKVSDHTNFLFTLKDNKEIGIEFTNSLIDNNEFNVYKYRNYYNGGGVAIGDINNDGLADVYMVSNQNSNQLYLNKGHWKFQNITEQSKTGGAKSWSTGVTMVDINGDNLLDIYVCNSGDIKGDNKENELFINNGDLTFTESAAKYGLNDKGYSTHAAFFDYDKDGDLDAYILNNSFKAIGSFDLRKNQRNTRDPFGGDKLYKNENGIFKDVSDKSGIYGSIIGFGLGITIADLNNDYWDDIFISNDFFERDYLYINQKNGTFKEMLTSAMPAISAASMGADVADINNDGWGEIFVTDMLPYEYERLKSVTTFDDWNRYTYGIETGYHQQFTRNMLHLNNKNGTFSDIGRLCGVEASDWSWGALFFDMENDGNKDLFIANGIFRDITDQDYLQYIANEQILKSVISDSGVDYKKLIDIIPSNPVENQSYKNLGNLQFEKYNKSGLWQKSFSNGSAYGDLDNDGDLDLVINNLNMPSFIYENNARNSPVASNYIKFDLVGMKKNTKAIGARIEVIATDATFTYQVQPARGFQSSIDPRINVGVNKHNHVDIKVIWPSGLITKKLGVATNQIITLNEIDAINAEDNEQLFQNNMISGLVKYEHIELPYNEFNTENLKQYMMSSEGPKVSMSDINGDELEDMIIPNSKGSTIQIFIQSKEGKYEPVKTSPSFDKYPNQETSLCHLFDADGDGDNDMYVASGGVELTEYSDYLYDDLLFNDGKGNFTNSGQTLPKAGQRISTGAVSSSDIDGDGDQDLFVGERVKLGSYGGKSSGYVLENNGKGVFFDITEKVAPMMDSIGMIKDALFADIDGDKKEELIIAGEFMPITFFKVNGNIFSDPISIPNTQGWWNVIQLADINHDGLLDIIGGNHGLNSRFRANQESPICLYNHDFDQNGFSDFVLTKLYNNAKEYPYHLRHSLINRMPAVKKKYPDYKTFKTATVDDIFGKTLLKSIKRKEVTELRSSVFINKGSLQFEMQPLPISAQITPVYAIKSIDIDDDNDLDLVLGGNLYEVQPEYGRYDASYGTILLNNGKGTMTDGTYQLGFIVTGAIRSIVSDHKYLHIFRNNDSPISYAYKKQR